MSEEASKLTFDVITSILFGEDISNSMDLCPYYEASTNQTYLLNAHDSITKLAEDQAFQLMNPFNSIFPFLVDYNIGSQNRALIRNQKQCFIKFQEFLDKSRDKTSVYCKILEETNEKKENVFWDMIAFLIGGHESSAKSLTTGLFQLKKNPEAEQKLRQEIQTVLSNHGFMEGKRLCDIINPEVLDEMPYLSNFIKEILRFTPPAARSLGYKTTQ